MPMRTSVSVLGLLTAGLAWSCRYSALSPHGLTEEKRGRELTPAFLDFDLETVERKVGGRAAPAGADEDRICIATVDDGHALNAAVINENGHLDFSVALPEGHEAIAAVRCTLYTDRGEELANTEFAAPLRYQPPRPCDPKSLRPGYYDPQQHIWHDACTGDVTKTTGRSPYRGTTLLSKDACPFSDRGRDLWVSFIGDSVHRNFFQNLFQSDGTKLKSSVRLEWTSGRNRSIPDFLLYGIGKKRRRLWLSFVFSYLDWQTNGAEKWPSPRTWGDFVRERRRGPHRDDPPWLPDRVPDVVFYSPGYHASISTAAEYGAGLEGALRAWQETSPPPVLHLMLNMMPAPWLIPEKWKADRKHRTLLNEHRKNQAIIAAATKFDVVRSVIDVFSLELPFNGVPGRTAHKDAVHVGDERVLRLGAERILETLCHSS